ncbi:hypothetical protein [Cribrihabitans neustonicus]|uniref:hypothetical protein n=1 Tax=Cribrihabitans neustonicus TaxID=1429085 RepID=UPI003B5B0DA5
MMPDLQPADARPSAQQDPQELPECLLGRQILEYRHYSLKDAGEHYSREMLSGDGDITLEDGHATARYSGELGSYQLRLSLPEAVLANGVAARIRLRGWQQISYIAIGYTGADGFEHVKASNPAQDQWFDFSAGHGDLAWGWQHGWDHPEDAHAPDIRLYIKGTPGEGAHLHVADMLLWREAPLDGEALAGQDLPLPPRVLHAIRAYELKCFRSYQSQARAFMEDGKCPLYGDVLLDWPADAVLPPALPETGTYQFSWHALHPAVMLMLYAQDTGETGPLFAARDFVMSWLERSKETAEANPMYTWSDHGAAERCLAMLQLFGLGQAHGFDTRCKDRLRHAIFRHARLLASEVFYAWNQRTRYHSHAWLQDLALLATALSFPHWECARIWAQTASARLDDQFSKLEEHGGKFPAFELDSIGYQRETPSLIEFAGALSALKETFGPVTAYAAELLRSPFIFRKPSIIPPSAKVDTSQLSDDGMPFMPNAETEYLTEMYKQAETILEYGSGGTTRIAASLPGKYTISVESDKKWAASLQHEINASKPASRVIVYHADIGPTGPWGRPLETRSWRKFFRYPLDVWEEPFFRHPDTVLIDGRLRNACMAMVLLRCTQPVTVLFDDYCVRPLYQEIERIISPTKLVGRMARFDVEPNMTSKKELSFLIKQFAGGTFHDGQAEALYKGPPPW